MISLIDLGKQKVCTEIIAAVRAISTGEAAESIFIVDNLTLSFVSSFMAYYDAYEAGACLIQSIQKSRDPVPERPAIYFIHPTQENVNYVIEDFKQPKHPKYSAAHIFWATSIKAHPGLMSMVANSKPLLPYIHSFVDANLGFGPFSQSVAICPIRESLVSLYCNNNSEPNQLARSEDIPKFVQSLSSLIATLGGAPRLRYHAKSRYCKMNQHVSMRVNLFVEENYPDLLSAISSTEVIILDRSIDALTLLLHDYTFEALVYDVLNISTNVFDAALNSAEHDTFTIVDPNKKSTVVNLNRNSALYEKYRYEHISDAIAYLRDEMTNFSGTNEAAAYQDDHGTSDLAAAIQSLPEYREILTAFYGMLHIADTAIKTLQEQNVLSIGTIEQDMATGVDSRGKTVHAMKLLEEIAKAIAANSAFTSECKIRLLLLYFATFDGVQFSDRERIVLSAGLSTDLVQVIETILELDLFPSRQEGMSGKVKHSHIFERDTKVIEENKRLAKKAESDLSRYVPAIQGIIDSAAQSKLPTTICPYITEGTGPDYHDQTSLTMHFNAEEWDWGTSEASVSSNSIVFAVLGPITFSEIRAAHEAAKNSSKNIYLVGTSVVSPRLFIQQIKDYNKQHVDKF